MKKLSFVFCLILFVAAGTVMAQSTDFNAYKKAKEAEFEAFKKNQEAEFEAFKQSHGAETKTAQHPEQKTGEVFLMDIPRFIYREEGATSFTVDSVRALSINFNDIPFKTKRLGKKSYDKNGNVVKDYIPVFVQEQEIRKSGK